MPAASQPLVASLGLLALGAARTVPLAWSVPAFGGPTVPVQLRLALGVGMAWLSWPLLAGTPAPVSAVAWALLAARELLVGVVMGFVCGCVFRAAEAAGVIVEGASGGLPASLPTPGAGDPSSPVGVLLLLLACAIFCEIGGVGHTLIALARSYDAIPLAAPLPVDRATRGGALLAMAASGKLIEAAIALAAPVLVALLLADLVLGIVGRLVPRIPVYAHAAPVRALLGVAALLVALAGIELAIAGRVGEFLGLLDGTLRQWL